MNEVKLQALTEHIANGGSLEATDLAEVLSVTPRSVKTIENYLAAYAETDEDIEALEIGGVNPYADDEESDEEDDEEEDDEEQDDEEDEDEEEPEPEPEAPKKKKQKDTPKGKPKYRFFYEGSDGVSREIERIESKSKGAVITFRDKSVKDIVKLMVKGELVEVDIIPLRREKPSAMSEYGVSNELLLNLALAAK